MSQATTNPTAYADTVEDVVEFLQRYYEEPIAELAQRYPKEQRHLTVSYDDLFVYDRELAERMREDPTQAFEWFEGALAEYPVPNVDLSGAAVRLVDLPDADTYRPLALTKQRPEGYVAVDGDLSKVMEPKPEADVLTYECLRCGTPVSVEQSGESAREPSECPGCERQGPFEFDRAASEFTDYTKIRVETPPDQAGDLQQEYIDGVVRGDLVWHGHDEHGLVARSGDPATVYGMLE